MKVSRAHVLRMLRISGVEPDEAERLLRPVSFPADLDEIIARFAHLGITRASLEDRMGGSP